MAREPERRDDGLSEHELRDLDHAVGRISVDGQFRGHLASVVGEMRLPGRPPWVWFLVIWHDGARELPFEDYGPSWGTVRELAAGTFEYREPSTVSSRRFLWWSFWGAKAGAARVFDYERLPRDEAAKVWAELGLTDSDF